ncbi:TauD/TfdA dioxygenase family protein [Jannaschia sp. 2305UL9-9]|uniref:TauD/TfdA dioxygenase family protein n=1 Tax=Jannaschia sp. 2305UL9-9 TaxID=3121638 RepID=UPI0035291889
MAYATFTATPYGPALGAEITDIDLTRELSPATIDELRAAFLEFQVLFFRDQDISFDDHERVARLFGPLGEHVGKKTLSKATDNPYVRKFHADENSRKVSGDAWHTDQSCAPIPPLGSMLHVHTVPPNSGGDTLFASMYAAYEALSPRMKTYLDGLTALHDGAPIFGAGTPSAEHPVVVEHPETGRKLLFVNRVFTTKIIGLSDHESRAILNMLFEHCERPEWQIRFRWRANSIAFWDNRCVHHCAIFDYWPNVRSGYRVQIEGTAPPVAAGATPAVAAE